MTPASAPARDAIRRRKREPATRGICGASKAGGGLCQMDPGQGTDHPGAGRCLHHGGLLPGGKMAAGVTIHDHLARGDVGVLTTAPVYGTPEKIAPADALLWCVAITAGEVRYLSQKVAELTEDEVLGRPVTMVHESGEGEKGYKNMRTKTQGPVEPHLWVRERQRAVDRLAKFSKMAIEAGVAERLVALAEFQATALADLFGRVFEQLSLTKAQKARAEPVLRAELLMLESGSVLEGGP